MPVEQFDFRKQERKDLRDCHFDGVGCAGLVVVTSGLGLFVLRGVAMVDEAGTIVVLSKSREVATRELHDGELLGNTSLASTSSLITACSAGTLLFKSLLTWMLHCVEV